MNVGMVVCVEAEHVSLRVSAESTAARRELGAVAWAVLETLALDGSADDGRWMAPGNARDLGRSLGIGKDRAASALAQLRRVGLVVAHGGRDTRSARFAQGRYEIRLPVSSSNDTPPAAHIGQSRTRASASARRSRAGNESPSLSNL